MALPGPGMISQDFSGSFDEYRERVISDLIRRYVEGLGGIGSDDPELGLPSTEDAGSGANGKVGQYSHATVAYWERFFDKYYTTDPFINQNYGPAPTRKATFVPDPNSASALQKGQQDYGSKENALDREEAAKDRASREADAAAERAAREAIARMQEEGETARQRERIQADALENEKARQQQSKESELERAFREAQAAKDRDLARERESAETGRVRERIASDEKIATMQDLTRRWETEGDWGVQKYIEEQREKGLMDRLQLTLGLEREKMAQDATAERNRHHEEMVGIVLKVAQYDSELAAQPVNWLKYAAWLQKRGQVVNGLTLAMAAEQVPEDAISPADVANSGIPGAGVASLQTQTQTPPAATGAPPAAGGQAAQTSNPPMQATTGAPAPTTTGNQPPGYTYNGIDLQNRNYADLLDQILNLNPNAAQPGVDNSQENIQATLDSLDTRGVQSPSQQMQGPSINLSGVGQFSYDPRGEQHDYRKFAKLLPAQQQMAAGAAQAAGAPFGDFLAKMQKARPKGGAVGATAYG